MKVSASRSRSMTRSPGRVVAARWARQAPSTRPAARIFSISSGRLSRKPSIFTAAASSPGRLRAEHGQDLLGHLVDRGRPVDTLDPGARPFVVLHHGCGVALVDAHPLGERVRVVVTPAVDDGAAQDPLADQLRVDLEVEDQPDLTLIAPQHPVECLRLGHGPGEAVQDHAPLGVGLRQPALDHADHQLVGHQGAALHDRLGLAAQLRPAGHLAPEGRPRGDVGGVGGDRHALGLGALPASGRAEEDDDHRMKPLYWRISNWVSICFMVSSATPTTIRIAVPPRRNWVVGTPVRKLVASGRTTVTLARKSAPASVIRLMTLPRYSAVWRPGLIPGMNVDDFLRLSATSLGSKTTAV